MARAILSVGRGQSVARSRREKLLPLGFNGIGNGNSEFVLVPIELGIEFVRQFLVFFCDFPLQWFPRQLRRLLSDLAA